MLSSPSTTGSDSFHSLEDRIVKQYSAGKAPIASAHQINRFAPAAIKHVSRKLLVIPLRRTRKRSSKIREHAVPD